jgi:hypothetical protein
VSKARAKLIVRRDGKGGASVEGHDPNKPGIRMPKIHCDNSQASVDRAVRDLKQTHEARGIDVEVHEV